MSAPFWASRFFMGDDIAPSPPPQPALTRLAAESDDLDHRYVAMRERALRAEAQVRDLEEARGELLRLLEAEGREVQRLHDACNHAQVARRRLAAVIAQVRP